MALPLLLVIYALSGLLSLGYESVWLRQHVAIFGSSAHAFGLVVATFVGGLGLGAALSRRLTAWLEPRVGGAWSAYALLEAAVALLALATLGIGALARGWSAAVPYVESGGLWRPALALVWLEGGAVLVGILLPCVAMGATFPLLCSLAPGEGRWPPLLAAANTAGAALGVLVVEHVLLPRVGLTEALVLLAGVNLGLAGVVARLVRGAPARGVLEASVPRTGPSGGPSQHPGPAASTPAASTPAALAPAALAPTALVTCALLGGWLTGLAEGDLSRRLAVLGADAGVLQVHLALWAVAALALAALVVRLWRGLGPGGVQLAAVLGAAGLGLLSVEGWSLRQVFLERMQAALGPGGPEGTLWPDDLLLSFPADGGQSLVVAALCVLPVLTPLALAFPWACLQLHRQGLHLGRVTALNTLAFCAGLLVASVGLPRVDVFFALGAGPWLVGAGVAGMLLVRRPGWALGLAGGLSLVALLVVPAGFDETQVPPESAAVHHPVRALASDGVHTTYVVAEPAGDTLFFDTHPMSATSADAQTYMGLMAHLPLLLRERPGSVLILGFGVGNTAAAAASHGSVERLDVVELNDQVLATAPEFRDSHGGVHEDPRVRLVHDDGRRFLAVGDERYDLITTEPPPLTQSGSWRLYSAEAYAAVRRRLLPGGFMTQWLPAYQVSQEVVDLVLSTFVQAFPYVVVTSGFERELVLLGSDEPIGPRLPRLVGRFDDDPAVVSDLAERGVRAPEQLLARVLMGNQAVRLRWAGGSRLRDAHNALAHALGGPGRRGVVGWEPGGLTGASWPPAVKALWFELAGEPGRAMASGDLDPRDLAAGAPEAADWRRLAWWMAAYREAAGRRETAAGSLALARALEVLPEQPANWLRRARLAAAAGDGELARRALEARRSLVGVDAEGALLRWALVRAAPQEATSDETEAALAELLMARGAAPWDGELHLVVATALRERGDLDGAEDAARQACRWLGGRPGPWVALAGVLLARGQDQEASRSWARALALDPVGAREAPAGRLLVQVFGGGP